MTRVQREGAQAGRVAVVLVVAMIAWLAVQWLGGRLGLPVALAFAADLAALAAFVWSLVETYRIWRARRES